MSDDVQAGENVALGVDNHSAAHVLLHGPGCAGSLRLDAPIVGMEANGNGSGYRFVASDGGIFSYNAPFFGSMGGKSLNKPVVDMAGN